MKPLIKKPLGQIVSVLLLTVVVSSSMFVLPLMADESITIEVQHESHPQTVEAWRTARHERLMKTDGWLTLVGLEWLNEGESRVGSAADNDIQLSGGPAYWGSVFLENDKLRFTTSDSASVKVDNESLVETVLISDTDDDTPTLVSSDAMSFYVIFRGSYGLRVKDANAKALKNFKGVDNFPIDGTWRIQGRFIRAEEGASIEIVNVLGQVSDSQVFGTFEFDMEGKTHSLLGLGSEDSEDLWFIFADRTSGRETYGAGRFLYSDGMPENGRLVVDFNKSYNPPCAFNPYSTCPLPPQRNRMDLLVTAGEKDFHPDSS
jgi:uncharacterized protein (DUF1684 family)